MNRIFVLCAGATLPAVVAVIGCAVDSDRFPGIKNDIPNARSGGGSATTTSSSSSSSTTSSTGGQAPNLCTCAATFVTPPDGGACFQCGSDTIGATGACNTNQVNCTDCSDAATCVSNCAGDATCVAGCITSHPGYQDVLNCQCSHCTAECSVPTQQDCTLGGTGGAGGGGTGGAAPDAGGDAGDAGDGG